VCAGLLLPGVPTVMLIPACLVVWLQNGVKEDPAYYQVEKKAA
jgi:hypothetical protein